MPSFLSILDKKLYSHTIKKIHKLLKEATAKREFIVRMYEVSCVSYTMHILTNCNKDILWYYLLML